MKTISFFSYQGGAGRTFTLANIGVYLARLGYKVVMLDFDFRAPGLPAKFGFDPWEDKTYAGTKGGVMDFIWQKVETGVAPESFEDYYIPLWPHNAHEENSDGSLAEKRGELLLIPTGNPSKEEYWERLTSPRWTERYIFDDEEKTTFFVTGLKGAIKKLGNVDYLLIDTEAGITMYGGVSNLLLADTVACFIVNNPTSVGGTKRVLSALATTIEKRKEAQANTGVELPSLRVVPVLNRLPHSSSHQSQAIAESIAGKIQHFETLLNFPSGCHYVDDPSLPAYPHALHVDRDVESFEHLIVDFIECKNVKLMNEITFLLDKLCPEVVETLNGGQHPEAESEVRAFLWNKIDLTGAPENVEMKFKIFALKMSQHISRLIHMEDEARNVAFKVDTLCTTLSHFANKMPDLAPQILKDAGKEAGIKFGDSLIGEGDRLPIQDMIQIWCNFDSEVGWGKLSLNNPEFDSYERLIHGEILVDDNFLAAERT
ncbi:MAG TPA: hypothetical protein VGB77_14885, partial [Abditibacteriaceae bacterium]